MRRLAKFCWHPTMEFLPVQVVWMGLCCRERSAYQQMLGPASVAVSEPIVLTAFGGEAAPRLQHVEFTVGENPSLIVVTNESCEFSIRACDQLLKRARKPKPAVLGFDCDWSVRLSTPRRLVATVQISGVGFYTFVFHLKYQENRPGVMPTALRDLMVNKKSVQLPGVSVCHDYILIGDSYGVQGNAPPDLGQLAGKLLGVDVGTRSLQTLVATLLHRRLHTGDVRTSNWEKSLTEEQVRTEDMKHGHYTQQDHYRVLGVDHKASHAAIREAYLKLAKKHHPDMSNGPQSAESFKAIASAWEVLDDKSKRALYDERLGNPVFRRMAEHRRDAPGAQSRGQRWSGNAARRSAEMPPILRAFELATHPRVLMVGIPLACVGYMLFGDHNTEEPTSIKVDAWLNPSTKRWETPAPWDEEFRERKHLVEKVDRSIVHEAKRKI